MMSPCTAPSPGLSRRARRALRRRRERAFTLIELLVATLAGLIVATGAYSFAKASTKAFSQESRIANAMSSTTLGFRRLVSDIERASYLSTPNIQRDYTLGNAVCLQPTQVFPIGIQQLAGVFLEAGGAYAATGTVSPLDATNLLSPDRITIGGSLNSTEQFMVRSIEAPAGASARIKLQPTSGPVIRTRQNDLSLAPWSGLNGKSGIFLPGRILRIVDTEGFQHFGVIQSVELDPADNGPVIVLANAPSLFMKGSPAPGPGNPICKGIGFGVGALVNVINRVRYEVRDMRAVNGFANLYGANPNAGFAAVDEDANRMELMRVELDAANNPIAGTEEMVGEYVVDLKFGLTVVTQAITGAQPNQGVTAFEMGSAQVYNPWGQLVTSSIVTPGAERIRSVRVRLATRSREADRDLGLAGPVLPGGQPGGLYRYKFASGKFARVRTLQADISLTNQAGVFW
jgi:prepilin-type N-terminal cleavage/methylation domain-containing protein